MGESFEERLTVKAIRPITERQLKEKNKQSVERPKHILRDRVTQIWRGTMNLISILASPSQRSRIIREEE